MTQFACVSMELLPVPLSDSAGIKQIDLYISIHCEAVWFPLLEGRLKYGLKAGKIILKLDNATLAEESRRLETAELSSESSLTCQAIVDAPETKPQWILRPKKGHSILEGHLENFRLGSLETSTFPYQVQAIFTSILPDFQVTDSEGLWPHDISPNKLAILERKLAILIQDFYFKDAVTQVKLQGNSWQDTVLEQEEKKTESFFDHEAIKQSIDQVLGAETHDFLALVKLVNLNPMTDFVGAKLLGVNLAGIDLSGANLAGANLRGADLSDADLSETQLNNVNLAGADLSGVLLSDANLTQSNLHRCSLALANLSGANLTQANLQNANLSHANLSETNLREANLQNADLNHAGLLLANLAEANLTQANIEATRFRKNTGISEQMQLNLKQRGAIFEDA